jgi:HEAT repeat protein
MRWPRIRLSLRMLLSLVACFALGLWTWVTYLSPVHRWHRTIRSDNESAARWEAASRALAGRVSGIDREGAISALCLALYDPSPRVRETAASTLMSAGPEARPAVPHLVMALKDVNSMVRGAAAASLGFIVGRDDSARKIAGPELVLALKDRSPDVRIAAGFALALMDRGESAIPVMTAAIHEGRDQAGKAVLALGLCGSRDEVAVKALKMALGSHYALVRRASADALERLAAPGPQPEP